MVVVLLLACNAGDSSAPEPEDTAEGVPRGALQFRFPLLERELFDQTVGVDHDPADYSGQGWDKELICTNYDGRNFPWCYDGHKGSDVLLVGGFDTMDAGSATILAACPGTVVETHDGEYDRCHATSDGVDCDGNSGEANYVIVEHVGGWRTKYWHMKNGSVAVAVGDPVECETPLGKVGSSGNSSGPHLHFQLEDAEGTVIDPFAGSESQPETWWVEQGDPEGLPGSTCAGG